MARRPAYKKIHYVRAVYSPNSQPGTSFDCLVREALTRLQSVADTAVTMATLGIVGVRARHSEWNNPRAPLKLALGAGTPDESMGTFGTSEPAREDADAPHHPPEERAFKLADAFVLIEENDLLIITDGSIRGYSAVYRYFKGLFDSANLDPVAQAFDLHPASNQDKRQTLQSEGVGSLALKGTMFAATAELDGQDGGSIFDAVRQMKRTFQALLTEEIRTEEAQASLARHWGEINVTTTITPKKSQINTPVVVEAINSATEELIDETPDDAEVVITTGSGNTIKSGDVILKKTVRLHRKDRRNDIDHLDAWVELDTYRDELRERGAWQR